MDVVVTRRYRGKDKGLQSVIDYNYSSNSNVNIVTYQEKSAILPLSAYPEPAVVTFLNTATPAIANYNILYAPVYGIYPKITLITYDDDDNELEMQQVPVRVKTDGILTSIEWINERQLPDLMSGKIIISK